MKITLVAATILLVLSIQAQETNYWAQNFGSTSFIRGGIEVGGVRNTTAIYYNPGALPFLEGSYFEAQADVFGFEYLFIRNGAGENIPVEYLLVDVIPSFFGFTKDFLGKDRFTIAFSVLTRANSNININVDHNETGNFLSPDTDLETFEGTFSYRNRIRENWLTAAMGYKLSERVGFGLATNLVVRTQDLGRYYNGAVYPSSELVTGNPVFSNLAVYSSRKEFGFRSLGFIFKPGINIDLNRTKLGLTITTPNLSLGLLNNRSSNIETADLPDVSDSTLYRSTTLDFYGSVYRTPWVLELGAEYFLENVAISASVAYFSEVGRYEMLKGRENSIINGTVLNTEPNFAIPLMAHKSIINAGVALSARISESFIYMGSFRTDFNYFDEKALSRQLDYVPNISYWDTYHITSGFLRKGPRTELSLGFNLGINNSRNDPQLISMSNPTQGNLLQGELTTDTRTNYRSISVVFGLNYTIDRMKGLKEDGEF